MCVVERGWRKREQIRVRWRAATRKKWHAVIEVVKRNKKMFMEEDG